jgi:beta-phosphoglucomutase
MVRDAGFIWDIDGVVLDSPHEESWRLTLAHDPWNTEGLTSEFYFDYVASRPRYEGANNILDRLGVYERLGADTEQERQALMEKYASQKDSLIKKLISRGEFKLFPDAVALLLKARRADIFQAAASASKNAATMLRNVTRARVIREVGDDFGAMSEGDTLHSMFDFDACGVDLSGKMEMLEYAARGLGKIINGGIDRYFVFEDAASGMEATKSLGYFAVGVWRLGDKEALEDAGADIVTDDLGELGLEDLLKLGT